MAKKTKARKVKSTTATGKTKALKAAMSDELLPPSHTSFPKGALPFWRDIVSARARALWDRGDLTRAVNLATTRWRIQKLDLEIAKEGDTIENKRGTLIANPKHSIVETLTRRELAITRQLQLHQSATIRPEDSKRMLEDEKQLSDIAAKLKDQDEDCELIPYPKDLH